MMAEWLVQAAQGHEMYSHDMEVLNSNPGRTELGCIVLLLYVALKPNMYIYT